jgi:hypothetical protein
MRVFLIVLALAMTTTQARLESVRRYGGQGTIQQSQTGDSTAWTYTVGVMTPYGFQAKGTALNTFDAAFIAPVTPTLYRNSLTEPIVMSVGRIQVGRNPDARADDLLLQAAENATHRRDAEERLSRFVDAVCSVAQKACNVAGAEFRVAITP